MRFPELLTFLIKEESKDLKETGNSDFELCFLRDSIFLKGSLKRRKRAFTYDIFKQLLCVFSLVIVGLGSFICQNPESKF